MDQKPLGELLAVRVNRPTEAILLPDWKRSLSGVVLTKGPEVRDLNVGDLVSFGAAKGMEAVLSGQDVRLMKEDDIDFVYEAEDDYDIAEVEEASLKNTSTYGW